MAKVIRMQNVYNKIHKFRYLPRPNDMGFRPFPYEEQHALPEHFPDCLPEEERPKLWVAWIYKADLGDQPRWVKSDVDFLFGEDWQPGRMQVFKNTPGWNRALWRIKHLIEIKPVTFPHGEPTEADVLYTTLKADGSVDVNPRLQSSVKAQLELSERHGDGSKSSRNVTMSRQFLVRHCMRRWSNNDSVHEDEPWTNPEWSTP